jgi:hypothetical protein
MAPFIIAYLFSRQSKSSDWVEYCNSYFQLFCAKAAGYLGGVLILADNASLVNHLTLKMIRRPAHRPALAATVVEFLAGHAH